MERVDTASIAESYAENGFLFPIEVMSTGEAAAYRAQLEALESAIEGRKLGNKGQLNYAHVICRFAGEIACRPRVLDAVEAVIGPDILLWGSTFFLKEPHTPSYVSWHQDLRYWGLEDEEAMVSAWLALGPVTRANGCMRFVPGSHKNAIVAHKDTFEDTNFLTRGQEADVDIDEETVVQVELEAGQISLHHGRLLHASAPNRSDTRRLGYAMNFIAPHNRQVVAPKDFATLVRGEDRYGHFELVPPPSEDLSPESLAWHRRILETQNEALYEGAVAS